jgi:hypothetical protein
MGFNSGLKELSFLLDIRRSPPSTHTQTHTHIAEAIYLLLLLLLSGAELPLVENFALLNDLFPLPLILDTGCPILDLQLANVLFDVILPSVLGSSW